MIPTTNPTAQISSGYLLIDRLNLPSSLDCDPLPIRVCVPPDLTNIISLLPGLVNIESLNAGQLLTLREIMELQTAGRHSWAISAVLVSDGDIEELSKHIASLLSVVDDDGRAVLWRFFDPRVFSLMMAVYSAEQKNALLGPLREWRFAWRGQWWLINGEGAVPASLQSFDIAWPSKVQWPLLRLSKLLDQVLLQVESDRQLVAADCLDVQRTALACLKEGASDLCFSEGSELIDYAVMGVKYGIAWLSNPKFKQAKADLTSGELNWWTFKNSLELNTLQCSSQKTLR